MAFVGLPVGERRGEEVKPGNHGVCNMVV